MGSKRIRWVSVRVFEDTELEFRVESPVRDRQRSRMKMMFCYLR